MSLAPPEQVRARTERWLLEAVLGLGLCPFAVQPQAHGRVRIAVSSARHVDGFLDDLDAELQRLSEHPAEVLETTLLVHADLFPDFEVFNDFADVVEAVIDEHGLSEAIELVLFHPDLRFEGAPQDSTENLPNRSPYPMLHLLRSDSLAQALPDGDSSAIIARNRTRLNGWTAAQWRAHW